MKTDPNQLDAEKLEEKLDDPDTSIKPKELRAAADSGPNDGNTGGSGPNDGNTRADFAG